MSTPNIPSGHRKRRRTARKILLDASDDADIDLATEEMKVGVKKTTKGSLSSFLELPMDLLFEVFGYLTPLELLRLARLTTGLRRILMNKTSVSVWMSSRNTFTGLPSPPPHMSEPAWANLIWDPHCHYCLTSVVHSIEWRFTKRICSRCAGSRILPDTDLYSPATVDEWHLVTLVLGIIPIRIKKSDGRHNRNVRICLRDEFEDLKKQYTGLETDDERKSFIIAHKKRKDEMEELAKCCEEWQEGYSKHREDELQRIKRDRAVAIAAKLSELGYEDDFRGGYPVGFYDLEQVKKPRPLTERGWKTIESTMVTYIEKMKSIRLSRERVVLLNSRKALAITFLRSYKNSRLPCTDILPEAADFCEFSAVKEIIERPSDAVVDLTDFELLDPKVGPMVRSWRKKIHKDLYGLTPDVARRKDENKLALVKGEPSALITFDQRARSHLELATSVFTCKKCTPRTQVQNPKKLVLGPVLSYPDVLAHRCFTREDRYASRTPEEKEDPSRKTCDGNWIRRTEWNNKQLSYDAKLVAIVSHFVTLVGLDPATTTTKEMDEMPYLLACCHCYLVEKAEFVVYGWRAAIAHTIQHELYPLSANQWVRLSRRDIEYLHNTGAPSFLSGHEVVGHPELDPGHELARWLCVHCRDLPEEIRPAPLGSIKSHLLEKHAVSTPRINIDYYEILEKSQHAGSWHEVTCILPKRFRDPDALKDASVSDSPLEDIRMNNN